MYHRWPHRVQVVGIRVTPSCPCATPIVAVWLAAVARSPRGSQYVNTLLLHNKMASNKNGRSGKHLSMFHIVS